MVGDDDLCLVIAKEVEQRVTIMYSSFKVNDFMVVIRVSMEVVEKYMANDPGHLKHDMVINVLKVIVGDSYKTGDDDHWIVHTTIQDLRLLLNIHAVSSIISAMCCAAKGSYEINRKSLLSAALGSCCL